MNPKLIDSLTKAGAAVILAALLAWVMHMNHEERMASDSRLFDLMERQAEALEAIEKIYSGQ